MVVGIFFFLVWRPFDPLNEPSRNWMRISIAAIEMRPLSSVLLSSVNYLNQFVAGDGGS